MKLTSEDICRIIETVRKGVDMSIFGPVCIYEDPSTPTQNPKKIVNQVAYQLFLTTLTGIINKIDQIEIVPSASPSNLDLNFQSNN